MRPLALQIGDPLELTIFDCSSLWSSAQRMLTPRTIDIPRRDNHGREFPCALLPSRYARSPQVVPSAEPQRQFGRRIGIRAALFGRVLGLLVLDADLAALYRENLNFILRFVTFSLTNSRFGNI